MNILPAKDFDASLVVQEIRSRIIEGRLQPHQQIAPEKDLAKEFGVSRSTIQKSLKELEREGLVWSKRGKGRFVTSRTRNHKTWTIGLILVDMSVLTHPNSARSIAGVRDVLDENGYNMQIYALNNRQIPQDPGYDGTRKRWMGIGNPDDLDGMIVLAGEFGEESLHELCKFIPVVRGNYPNVYPNLASVYIATHRAAYTLTRHLIELGHRSIGLVTFNMDMYSSFWASGQIHGVQLGMQEWLDRGQGRCKLYPVSAAPKHHETQIRRVAREFLDDRDHPTAIICPSDNLALAFYRTITDAGLKVPGDVSLAGWNDTLTLQDIPVPMTSVYVDYHQAGVKYAEKLLWLIDHPNQTPLPEEIEVSKVFIRQSTAPPRK